MQSIVNALNNRYLIAVIAGLFVIGMFRKIR